MLSKSVIVLIALSLIACVSPPLTSYPWAISGESCDVVIIGSNRPGSSCVIAKGTVRSTDGSPILSSYAVEVWFFSARGGEIIHTNGADFTIAMDRQRIRDANLYSWEATVRESKGGKILFWSNRPQPFMPRQPIVIMVQPNQ